MAEHKYRLVGSVTPGASMGVILGPAHYVGFGDEFVADEGVIVPLMGQFIFEDLGLAHDKVKVVVTVESAPQEKVLQEDEEEREEVSNQHD